MESKRAAKPLIDRAIADAIRKGHAGAPPRSLLSSSHTLAAMLRRPRVSLSSLAPAVRRRQLHDKGIWGLHEPSPSNPESFTAQELSNRARNASLLRLVESYRRHGHRAAKLDPLDLVERAEVPALDARRYGFKLPDSFDVRADLKSSVLPDEPLPDATKPLDTRGILDFPPELKDNGEGRSIEQIATWLEETYCQGVGYEFMHLPDKGERRFLEQLLESSHSRVIPPERQLEQWRLLVASETFDAWAAKRFPQVKRYGLEGAEGMMVAVEQVFKRAIETGAEEMVMWVMEGPRVEWRADVLSLAHSAMPHRGRLNLLTQLLGMDMRILVRKVSRGQIAVISMSRAYADRTRRAATDARSSNSATLATAITIHG